MRKKFYLYIMTNLNNTVLYIGTTSDLIKRVYAHKSLLGSKFTSKYHLTKLVYYELGEDMQMILHRERLMKKWRREWKIQLIKSKNQKFLDLYNEII